MRLSALVITLCLTWTAVGLVPILPIVSAFGQSSPAVTPEAIDQAIRDLAAEDYEVREHATDFLSRAGKPAQVAVTAATKSTDPEVKLRAQIALEQIKLTPSPATPAELLPIIEKYRQAAPDMKGEVFNQLIRKNAYETVFELLENEPNREVQQYLALLASAQSRSVLSRFLRGGQDDEAEKFLIRFEDYLGPSPTLAAFMEITGRTEKRVTEWEALLASKPEPKLAYRVAILHRARGDLTRSRQRAALTESPDLKIGLAVEAGQWKEALASFREVLAEGEPTAKDLALIAVYSHFGGLPEDHRAAIAALHRKVEIDPADVWWASQPMLISEHFEEALNVVKKHVPGLAYYLLVAQQRYDDAFTLVGFKPDMPLDERWFRALPNGAPEGSNLYWGRHILARDLADTLTRIGNHKDALRVRDAMREAARSSVGDEAKWVWTALGQAGLATGDRARALDDFSLAIDQQILHRLTVMTELYGQPGHSLGYELFDLLKDGQDSKSTNEILAEVDSLLGPGRMLTPPGRWRKLVDQAHAAGLRIRPKLVARHYNHMANICMLRGDRELAQTFIEQLAATGKETSAQHHNFAFEHQDWPTAVKYYEQPRRRSDGGLDMIMLSAAQRQVGRLENSLQRRQIALREYPGPDRFAFCASIYRQAGLAEAALGQQEITVRVTPVGSDEWFKAAEVLAEMLHEKAPERVALLWQQHLIFPVVMSSNLEWGKYLSRPAGIRVAQARAAIAAGQPEQAAPYLRKALAALPGGSAEYWMAICELDQAGHSKLADELFSLPADHLTLRSDEFPQSIHLRLELARLEARCRRRLDDALERTRQAWLLNKERPDTLAAIGEVRLARGEVDAAAKMADRALASEPDNPAFQQLQQQVSAARDNK